MSDEPPELSRRILQALANELCPHCRTWGEQPDLLFVFTEGGHVGVRGLGLPGCVWSGREPAVVVTGIALAAEAILPSWPIPTPAWLLGVGLRCEAHYLREVPYTEVVALSQADVRTHPKASTGRFACAVDRNGITYAVETDDAGEVCGGRIVMPGDSGDAAVGTIPDALDRILSTFLRKDMPVRPPEYPDYPAREEPR